MDVETRLGRALHRAGFTTYDYATAEIKRLLRCFAEEGLAIAALSPEPPPVKRPYQGYTAPSNQAWLDGLADHEREYEQEHREWFVRQLGRDGGGLVP